MSDPYAIALAASVPAPVLTLGSGLPTEIEGQPVAYRRKEIARAGKYVHRGTRKEFELTPARLAALSAAFRKRFAKGIKPPITPYHVDPEADFNADDTLGYVVGVEQDGESLYGTLQLIGERALSAAARNDVSIATVADAVDADGEQYGESLHHVSLTPDPALSHLKPYLKIAASAGGGPARKALILSAAYGSSPMDLKKIRAALKLADDVPDDKVLEQAAERLSAPPPPDNSAEVTALSAKVQALETERDAAKAEALRLSASAPRQPDDLTVTMYGENIAAKREQAIAKGAVSATQAKVFDEIIADGNGRPTALALSACGASRRPLGFVLWDAVAKLADGTEGNIRTGNQVQRAVGVAPAPNHTSLTLSGGTIDRDKLDRQAELLRQQLGLDKKTA